MEQRSSVISGFPIARFKGGRNYENEPYGYQKEHGVSVWLYTDRASHRCGYYRHTGYNKSSESPGSGLEQVAQEYLVSAGLVLKMRYWLGMYSTQAKIGLRAKAKGILKKFELF